MQTVKSVRIDKWLWAVRIFKTRSQAAEACKKGHVKIDGISIKPSRELKLNEEIIVRKHPINRKYRVKGLIEKRVSAKLAVEFVDDITPQEEIDKLMILKNGGGHLHREKGAGRPTKRERRDIDKIFE